MLPDNTDLATWPHACKATKLPLPVTVDFAHAAGVCATLEGPVAYAAGDAILTGVRGEHWPIVRARFEQTYEAAPGTVAGQPGTYRKRPLGVMAVQLEAPVEVALGAGRGVLRGAPGDWLVQYGPGDFGVVAADIFGQTYRVDTTAPPGP